MASSEIKIESHAIELSAEAEVADKTEEETQNKAEEEVSDKAGEEAQKRADEEASDKAEVETEETAEQETEEQAEEEAQERIEEEATEKAEEEDETETEAAAEAEVADKTEAGTQEEAEAEEKGSKANESAAKEEVEAYTEGKDVASDANAIDAAEEEVAAPDGSEESAMGTVSEAIQKMTQSSSVLVGESGCISLTTPAKDIMHRDVVWSSPDDSVQHALTTMQQHDTGYLMVGKDGVVEGIVSNSNITGAISPYLRPIFAKWRRPLDDATLNIRVKWMMSRPVRTIKPETSLAVIIEDMLRFGCRCLPVVNKEGKVEGLVTVFDILKELNKDLNIYNAGKTPQAPPLV